MERIPGIEPGSSAWKAAALPLSYTRIVVGRLGFEPRKAEPRRFTVWGRLPHLQTTHVNWCRQQESNLRPPAYKADALPTELHRHIHQQKILSSSIALNAHLRKYIFDDGAGNEVRTRDLLLGKQMLYQLSYSRMLNRAVPGSVTNFTHTLPPCFHPGRRPFAVPVSWFYVPATVSFRITRLSEAQTKTPGLLAHSGGSDLNL